MNKVINVCLSVSFTFHVIASEWTLLMFIRPVLKLSPAKRLEQQQ